jgi:hypothetical protein
MTCLDDEASLPFPVLLIGTLGRFQFGSFLLRSSTKADSQPSFATFMIFNTPQTTLLGLNEVSSAETQPTSKNRPVQGTGRSNEDQQSSVL